MISNIFEKLITIVVIIFFGLIMIGSFILLKKTSFEVTIADPIFFKETVNEILKIRTPELCRDDQLNEDLYYFVKEILHENQNSALVNIDNNSKELGMLPEDYIKDVLMSNGDNIRAQTFILQERKRRPRIPGRKPSALTLFPSPPLECARIALKSWLLK